MLSGKSQISPAKVAVMEKQFLACKIAWPNCSKSVWMKRWPVMKIRHDTWRCTHDSLHEYTRIQENAHTIQEHKRIYEDTVIQEDTVIHEYIQPQHLPRWLSHHQFHMVVLCCSLSLGMVSVLRYMLGGLIHVDCLQPTTILTSIAQAAYVNIYTGGRTCNSGDPRKIRGGFRSFSDGSRRFSGGLK